MLPILNNVLRQQVRYSATFFQPSEQYLLVEEISTSSVQANAVRKSVFPVSWSTLQNRSFTIHH